MQQGQQTPRLPAANLAPPAAVPNNQNGVAAVAAANAAAAAAGNQTGRTVYIGGLPTNASMDELLNLVHYGPIESVRVLPEKNCVFISFLDGATAAAFHASSSIKKLALHGQELKIGWGKASPVPATTLMNVQQHQATRNVYLGGLDEGTTEESLRTDLQRYGLIDQVKIVRDKHIGFVHFLSISVATKVRLYLPSI
jgi:RNA recognition motif-containing protein